MLSSGPGSSPTSNLNVVWRGTPLTIFREIAVAAEDRVLSQWLSFPTMIEQRLGEMTVGVKKPILRADDKVDISQADEVV